MPTEIELNAFLGKHISAICPNGYQSNSDNHCAHFVSHVLGYQFGVTCRTMSRGTGAAATIRVQDLFTNSLQVGPWNELPFPLVWGFVFITNARNVNVARKTMVNVPRKHVGIFCGGLRRIWHYSNSQRKVISQTPQEFSNHYPAPDNAMFWGSAP